MRFCPRVLTLALLLTALIGASSAKEKVRIASDGFPTGQDTPEGAASDLARAFTVGDAAWFRTVCIQPYAGGPLGAEYAEYLDGVSLHMKQDKNNPPADNPKAIVQVFAARHLTHDGPASYGYASFGFQDVMFVDVEVLLRNGHKHLKRTLVIEDRDGKWYAHPVTDVAPLLSYGLYDESASVKRFGDANVRDH